MINLKRIIVKIPREGKIEYETQGYRGDACMTVGDKFIAGLKRCIGFVSVKDTKTTEEFYEQETHQEIQQ